MQFTDRPGCRTQLLGPVFLLIALVVYWPARHAGFVTDWIGGQELYEQGSLWQALHSFGWRAILPVMFTLNYLIFKAVGTWWVVWFGLFVSLHAANAWQLLRLAERLPGMQAHPNRKWVAAGVGLLFLLSPYAAEPVIWKACVQYELGLLLFLSALHEVLHDVEMPAPRFAFRIVGLFVVGIFLTEWMVIMPALVAFFVIGISLHERQAATLGKRLTRLALPIWVLLGGWFLLNKYYLGHWAGHYGDDTHLNLDVQVMGRTILKYWAKTGAFVRYLPDMWQQKIYNPLDRAAVVRGVLLLGGVVLIGWAAFQRELPASLRWAGLAAGLSVGAFLPVSNLYFSTVLLSENDRYSYFGMGFFWMMVLFALSGLPRWIFRPLVVVLLAISTLFLIRTVRLWAQAETVYDSLVQDFRWYDREEVIILASPDNLRGVPVARIMGEPSGIIDALKQRRGLPFEGRMYEAVQFNMVRPSDGIKVERDSTGLQYKISFMQDGNWFWREGIGAKSYQNEIYTLKKNEWDCTVTFYAPNPKRVVIYPVGGRWVEAE
jgi:hypothetical protein